MHKSSSNDSVKIEKSIT